MPILVTDNPLFLIPLLTGLIFVLAGFVLWKFPPKDINYIYGYRSKRSMQSQAQWDFAQAYAGKRMMLYGGLLALSCLLGLVFRFKETTAVILGLGLMILTVLILIIDVERALKRQFAH